MKSLLLLDLTGRVFLKKEKIFYWLVSAFFISLFLPDMPVINNILIGATVIHSFYYSSFGDKMRLLRKRKEIWLMLGFFVWQVVSALLSANRQEGLRMLVMRLPLLVFPLFIGSLYIREELKDRILLSYCLFTTLACTVCMAYAIWQYRETGNIIGLFDENLTMLLGRRSVYIAMGVNIALFTYVYLLQKNSFAIQYKGLVFLSIIFLVIFHYMLANRIAIATLYTGFACFTMYHYGRARQWWKAILLIAVLIGAAAVMLCLFPDTANRFRQLTHQSDQKLLHQYDEKLLTADQYNETNFRLAIWKGGWAIHHAHPWAGVPLGDKQAAYLQSYRDLGLDFALEANLNMHNTYLDVLCNTGCIGLLVFVLGYLILPMVSRVRYKDGLGLFIVIAFGIAMCTETWPDRSLGCIMLGFFLSLVSAWKKEDNYHDRYA